MRNFCCQIIIAIFLSVAFFSPVLSQPTTIDSRFCVNQSPGCSYTTPCSPCRRGELGVLNTRPLPGDSSTTRRVTFMALNIPDAVYNGSNSPRPIRHSACLRMVVPIQGGKIEGTFGHATVELNSRLARMMDQDPATWIERRTYEFDIQATYSGGPEGKISGRILMKSKGGTAVPFHGTLKADGTGVIYKDRYRMDVRFTPFDPATTASTGNTDEGNTLVQGLAAVAGTGVGLYLLLNLLGLAGGKSVPVASVATGVDPSAACSTIATEPPPTVQDSRRGETRVSQDPDGTQWQEVFDGQHWVDSGSYSATEQQQEANLHWQQEQMQRQINHDTTFDRAQQERLNQSRQELARKQDAGRQDYRKSLQALQDIHQGDQARAMTELQWEESKTQMLEWGKTTIDFTVQALATNTGPVGWVAGNAYTLATDLAEGVSQGIVEADTVGDALSGVARHSFNGLMTGLCKVAAGEALSAAGAGLSYGARNIAYRVRHFNRGTAPLAPVFHSSAPLTELVQMGKNMISGKSVMSGVESGMANVGIQTFRKAVSGEAFNQIQSRNLSQFSRLSRETARTQLQFIQQAKSGDFWGTLQGLRGIFIDDPLGTATADTFFHVS